MIQSISNIKDLDKIWRNKIIEQSNLPAKNVLNGLSIRGVDLSNYITTNISMSYSLKNIAVVFEISTSSSEDNISMEEDDGDITEYVIMNIRLSLYGSAAIELAKTLKARFESSKCRDDLYNQGIYFKEVTELTTTNDFINETMWTRVDLSIDFGIRLLITQKNTYEDFLEMNDISITEL